MASHGLYTRPSFPLTNVRLLQTTPLHPSPLSLDTPRQSPFRRPPSDSPATVRATTPTTPSQSPTKQQPMSATLHSPTKSASLSPEKASPFARRPSQIGRAPTERPLSPFTRPNSSISLGLPSASPSRASSGGSKCGSDEDKSQVSYSRVSEDQENASQRFPSRPTSRLEGQDSTSVLSPPSPNRLRLSPSPLDGPADSTTSSQHQRSSLRPAAQRIPTSSTVSTIKATALSSTYDASTSVSAPKSTSQSSTPACNNHHSNNPTLSLKPAAATASYTSLPAPLLRSLRESFSVLDASASGILTPTSLAPTLQQLGLDSSPQSLQTYFPPTSANGKAEPRLTLAQYLDLLAQPLAHIPHSSSGTRRGAGVGGGAGDQDELRAAFEAFDLDDCGSVDVEELRAGVLAAVANLKLEGEMGEALSEGDIDAVLGEFSGRRAFGATTGRGGNGVGKGRGEVFRYGEFVARVGGAGVEGEVVEV